MTIEARATTSAAGLVSAVLRVIVIASMSAGCDPAVASPVDASTTDAGGLALPAPPVLPTLTPCRAGWREIPGDDGVMLCEPWPASGRRDDCASDEAHFPGTPGCARIGTACAADGWPTDLPADRNVVFVSAAAAPGGNGLSRATAFSSIGTAADAAPFDSVIAIAAGNYDEGEIYVGPGITLWGACVAGTVVTSTSASTTHSVVFLADDGSGARNLRVESPERLGVYGLGTPSTLTDVVVQGARTIGVASGDGVLMADHVAIRGLRDARGLNIQGSGSAVLHFVRIDGATELGIGAQGATAHLTMQDCAVVSTLRLGTSASGIAIAAGRGAQVSLSGVVLESAGVSAVFVTDAGTMLEGSDVVVRHDTRPECSGGVLASDGGTVHLSRALFEDQQGAAMAAQGAGSRITIEDTVVRDVHYLGTPGGAGAVQSSTGGALVLDRVLVARAADGAIMTFHAGSTVDARDVVVIDMVGTPTGAFGHGLVASSGAAITVERARFERTRDVAMVATGAGSSIDGRAIAIRDVLGEVHGGDLGVGAWAELGAHMTLTDVLVERARFAAVGAIGGGVLTLSRATIRMTLAAACGDTTCADRAGGFAIAAPYGGIVTATDFVVEGAVLCGVVVGATTLDGAASLDLHHGTIRGVPIGACVQAEGYDTERLHDGVAYEDVGIPLQATSYALPGSLPAS